MSKKTRPAKKAKMPYRVLIGRVKTRGKQKYAFEKHGFNVAAAAISEVTSTINGKDSNVRELIVLINQEAK